MFNSLYLFHLTGLSVTNPSILFLSCKTYSLLHWHDKSFKAVQPISNLSVTFKMSEGDMINNENYVVFKENGKLIRHTVN